MNEITFIIYVCVGQRKYDVQCGLSLFSPEKNSNNKLENVKISTRTLNIWIIFHVFPQKETENLL